MFVTLLRRVLIEDKDLPFPESIAAAEIHKSGQRELAGQSSYYQEWASVLYLPH